VTAKTKNGLTPLHMAAQGDHTESARVLHFHKAPIEDVTMVRSHLFSLLLYPLWAARLCERIQSVSWPDDCQHFVIFYY